MILPPGKLDSESLEQGAVVILPPPKTSRISCFLPGDHGGDHVVEKPRRRRRNNKRNQESVSILENALSRGAHWEPAPVGGGGGFSWTFFLVVFFNALGSSTEEEKGCLPLVGQGNPPKHRQRGFTTQAFYSPIAKVGEVG